MQLSKSYRPKLAILVVLLPLMGFPSPPSDRAVTVRVIGRGESEWAARNDAVRQALQAATRQLVIADRVVSDDKVLRDTVMSTMNGFVDKFEVIRTFKDGGDIAVEADITVSNSRIQNFLGTSIGGTGPVRGSDLAASLQGELATRAARAEIFWRLFSGYPGKAIQIKIDKVGLNEINPNLIMVDYTLSTDEAFVTAFKQGVTTLTDSSSTSHGKGEIRQESQHPILRGLGNTLYPQLARTSAGTTPDSSTGSKVCIGDSFAQSSDLKWNDRGLGVAA